MINQSLDEPGGENVFLATFALMFGAMAAGQANQYGPDLGKGKKAAVKVFTYIDTPSRIDPVATRDDEV